jgi:site-specific recombinase XerD
VPNTGRFRRVERGLHRHVRSGELWFVGRQGGKVVWRRLRTHELRVARATVAMLDSNPNGNTAIFLVVDGKEQPIPQAAPVVANKPLPQVREVLVATDSPVAQTKALPATPAQQPGIPPTLDEFLNRWRGAKDGLKPGTEEKLDHHLTMVRRYVDTHRPVTDYKPQDIREYLAKARADRIKKRRRLKGQTINEAIWRPLQEAFALAVEESFIARNPMSWVKREKTEPVNRNQHKWMDAERILEDVRLRAHESYLELKFMLFLGVGQAETKNFDGGAVDWQEKRIGFVRRKTSKPFSVPIYPWAEEFVRVEMEPRLKQGKPVFDWRNPRKALHTACRHLGLARVEIRSLRRTLIVHRIQQHVDVRLIAKWQGHNDAQLILKRYGAHIDEGYEKEALASLNAAVTNT